ncbi:MAG: hypothetical protein WCA20_18115 [Candidatus Sulfotelmatobacter sp.]
MWKKQDDAGDAQPEFSLERIPDLESVLKEKFKVGPQKGFTEGHKQPSSPAPMETYTEAVNQFRQNATWFIEQLPLLAKARDAYEQAMRTSGELRKMLDAGEESLRTLMTQLEEAVHVQAVKAAADRKKPEPAKVEAIRATNENTGSGVRLP